MVRPPAYEQGGNRAEDHRRAEISVTHPLRTIGSRQKSGSKSWILKPSKIDLYDAAIVRSYNSRQEGKKQGLYPAIRHRFPVVIDTAAERILLPCYRNLSYWTHPLSGPVPTGQLYP